MRAISAATLDSLADYAEIAIAAPEPGPGQVRIRVAAVGIGCIDALVAFGRYQVKPPLPHIPGSEIAGTIDAIVADRGRLQPGETLLVLSAAGGSAAPQSRSAKHWVRGSSQLRRRRKSVHLHCNTVPMA